jgi:hypothetical protein
MQNSPLRVSARAGGHAPQQNADQLAAEFPILGRYLGDIRFNAAVQGFLLEAASRKVKSSATSFPDFLRASFKTWPEIGELARLEQGFKRAGEIHADHSFALPASALTDARQSRLRLHPSVQLLVFNQNTTSLWSCLVCGEVPPRPYHLDQPQYVIIWRHDRMPRFRILGDDEARDLAAFQKRPSRQSPYFLGWVKAGLVLELLK